MEKRDNGAHGSTVRTCSFFQSVHAGDGVWNESLATGHGGLRDNIKTVDVCEIEGKFRLDFPKGMKDESYLPHKKT